MLKDFYRNNSKGSVKVSDIRFYSPEADSLWNIMNLENYLYNMDFGNNGLGGLCRLTFHNAVDFSVNGLYRGNTAVMQVILENGEVEEYRLDLRGSRTYDANQRGFSLVALECRYFTKDPKKPSAMPKVPVALLSVGKCRKIYTILDNTVVPVDAVTPLVVRTRSVNTLFWNGSDLCGTSTDPIGFTDGLAAHGVSLDAVKRVAIVGNGGVARVVISVLRGKPITLVCRNKSHGEMLAQEIDPETIQAVSLEDFIASDTSVYDLIVNTSPVGMFPDVDASPLPKEALHPNQVAYDLIYNPTTTKLLCLARNAGCKTVAGYEMFLHQAIESDKVWFPQLCDVDPAELYKVAELGFHRCD